jgi:geranylgeranyl diphosphate synthase type II
MSFDETYKCYLTEFQTALNDYCKQWKCEPPILGDSMKYSLLLGGKRIRPVMMLACADLLGVEHEVILKYAIALEMIHTYSLIHDDLPEMDNDDFRRGKPSNHKVFGTGHAVLAGDGLLNTAYSLLFELSFLGNNYLSASKFICDCAGVEGMIAGQSADLLHEHDQNPTQETLEFIYLNKTAKLLTAPVVVPSILSGGKYYSELKKFGEDFGYLFQLTDDILDVEGTFQELGKSVGKDKDEGKLTGVAVFGLDECKLRADLIYDSCLRLLEGINGETTFLQELVGFVRKREH